MSIFITILVSSLVLISADNYKKLSKHSSVKVPPETKVYFDISSFEIGDLIPLEIKMDLFFGDSSSRSSYSFYIEQVPATSYYDPYYWDLDKLRYVTNKNVSCGNHDVCTFTWEEIKEEGKNFIFIYPPAPFDNFYTFWDEKIKITHPGGLSGGAIAGIVIACIFFAAIFITLIAVCCCCSRNRSCYDCCPCCSCCYCCYACNRRYTRDVVSVSGGIPQPIYPPVNPAPVYPAPIPAQVYPQPIYPQTVPVYPQPGIVPAPYSSNAFI